MCVWEIYTLHSACAWVREIAGYLESEGRDVCMPERQSDRDLCWGLDFTRERVLMCSCVGVWGERTISLSLSMCVRVCLVVVGG